MAEQRQNEVRRERRGEALIKATRGLRAAIISGEMSGGAPVLEEEWAARLGMSRTPVRDAIGRLVGEGLLVKKGRQVYLFRPSLSDLIEVYEIRLALEKQAAAFATATVTDKDIALMRDNVDQLEAATDSPEWFEIHEKFHMGVFDLSGRTKLTSLIQNLRLQSEPYVRLAVHADPQFRAASIRDHQEIVNSLACRDADAIDKVVDRHLNTTCDELRRLLALRIDLGGIVALVAGTRTS